MTSGENAPKPVSAAKPTFRVFRIREAAGLTEDSMTLSNLSPDEKAALGRSQKAGAVDGGVVRVLFEDEVAGISLTYAWFKANYLLPRHSHNADCLYYVISGEAKLGAEVLEAGDGFFVPADGLYTYAAGPEGVEVLEFRTAAHYDFRLKTGESFWARMIDGFAANREKWKSQTPPPALQRLDATEQR